VAAGDDGRAAELGHVEPDQAALAFEPDRAVGDELEVDVLALDAQLRGQHECRVHLRDPRHQPEHVFAELVGVRDEVLEQLDRVAQDAVGIVGVERVDDRFDHCLALDLLGAEDVLHCRTNFA
jgi:hypothetical protein